MVSIFYLEGLLFLYGLGDGQKGLLILYGLGDDQKGLLILYGLGDGQKDLLILYGLGNGQKGLLIFYGLGDGQKGLLVLYSLAMARRVFSFCINTLGATRVTCFVKFKYNSSNFVKITKVSSKRSVELLTMKKIYSNANCS